MTHDNQNELQETESVSTSRRNLFRTGGLVAAAGLAGGLATQGVQALPNCETVAEAKYYPLDSFTGDVSVAGQTIVITGGSRGIGLATGLALQAKGANVIGTSRTPGNYPTHPFTLLQLDIADPASVGAFPGTVMAETGGSIGALINNAGRFVFGTPIPFPPIDPVVWHAQTAISMATLHLGHIGVTNGLMGMVQPGGAIMFTVSITGYSVGGTDIGEANGQSFLSAYYSGKRALLAYANNLRGFLRTASIPIRVATVNPFAVNTDLAAYGVPIVLEEVNPVSGVPLNPVLNQVLQGVQSFLANGLPPSMVADTYCQLLEMGEPTPNVVVASPEEPFATQGGNELLFEASLAENLEAAAGFGSAHTDNGNGKGK